MNKKTHKTQKHGWHHIVAAVLKKVVRKSSLLLTCLLSCRAGKFIYSDSAAEAAVTAAFGCSYQNPASSAFKHILNPLGLQCQIGTAETPSFVDQADSRLPVFSVSEEYCYTTQPPSCNPTSHFPFVMYIHSIVFLPLRTLTQEPSITLNS